MHTYMSVIKCAGERNVVGSTDKVEEILKITDLHQVFPECKDEHTALQRVPSNGSKRKTRLEIVRPSKNLAAQKKRSS
jgi:hypothetical protein